LEKGDLVLIRVGSIRGSHKVHDKWEKTLYEVEGPISSGVPVYVVCDPLTGKKQTQHRNRLYLLSPTGGTEVSAVTVKSAQVAEEDQGYNPEEPGVHETLTFDGNGPDQVDSLDQMGEREKDETRSGATPPDAAPTILDRITERGLRAESSGYLSEVEAYVSTSVDG
jgi:hypothetical protein